MCGVQARALQSSGFTSAGVPKPPRPRSGGSMGGRWFRHQETDHTRGHKGIPTQNTTDKPLHSTLIGPLPAAADVACSCNEMWCGVARLYFSHSAAIGTGVVYVAWIAPRVRDQTPIARTPREHTATTHPRAAANTTVTATTPPPRREDGHLRRPMRRAPPAPSAPRRSQQAARRVGQRTFRNDATPTPGAADGAVGSAPSLPSPPHRARPPPAPARPSTHTRRACACAHCP